MRNIGNLPLDNISIQIPAHALHALSLLENAGFEAWCVGGFVRDAFLSRESSDIDIATSAPWRTVQTIFSSHGFATHETGVAHGTITVVMDSHPLEITTYRTEGAYSDRRHPDSVTFANSISEDLLRRDFTINALAYHPERGLLDLHGGLSDLRAGVIRTVGNPLARFDEDPLRVLRACRFCSQLGFVLEEGTYAGALECKHLLPTVATERMRAELDKLLLGDYVYSALMGTADILFAALPELAAMKGFDQKTPYHIYDVWEHTAWAVQHSPNTTLSRWSALLHDAGKPAAFFTREDGVGHFYGHAALSCMLARSIMTRLGFSHATCDRVIELVKRHDDVIEPNPRAVKRALARMGGDAELFSALCALKRADSLSQAPQYASRVEAVNELERIMRDIIAANEAFSLKDLAINGHDILSLGVTPGPSVGMHLSETLDAVIDGHVANERDALLGFVSQRVGMLDGSAFSQEGDRP